MVLVIFSRRIPRLYLCVRNPGINTCNLTSGGQRITESGPSHVGVKVRLLSGIAFTNTKFHDYIRTFYFLLVVRSHFLRIVTIFFEKKLVTYFVSSAVS